MQAGTVINFIQFKIQSRIFIIRCLHAGGTNKRKVGPEIIPGDHHFTTGILNRIQDAHQVQPIFQSRFKRLRQVQLENRQGPDSQFLGLLVAETDGGVSRQAQQNFKLVNLFLVNCAGRNHPLVSLQFILAGLVHLKKGQTAGFT